MRNRFLLPVVLLITASALTATALTTTALGMSSRAADVTANHSGQSYWLPGGPAVTVTGSGMAAIKPGGSTLSDTLVSLMAGGVSYAIPVDALPYFGHGLSPALFDTRSLIASEKSGRLPVRLSYQGRVPALPGVTITSSGNGEADGYLTQASSQAFTTALARQYQADRGEAASGTSGPFGAGTVVSVPGSTLSGQPDTGDSVYLINVDDAQITGNPQTNGSAFYHGAAKFSLPAGHYFAIAMYTGRDGSVLTEQLPRFGKGLLSRGWRTLATRVRLFRSEHVRTGPGIRAPVSRCARYAAFVSAGGRYLACLCLQNRHRISGYSRIRRARKRRFGVPRHA